MISNISNINVKYFERFLTDKILNGYIQKIQRLDTKDYYLKIRINTKDENKILLVGNGRLILTKYNPKVRDENKGFSKLLNKKIYNKRILSIDQINYEKILRFEFYDFYLYIELFSHNNIILTDKENTIIDCLYKEVWKDRVIKPKQKYTLPPSNFSNANEYKFREEDFDLEKNLVVNIIKAINVPPNIVEIVLNNLKIDKEKYNYEDAKIAIKEIKEIYDSQILVNSAYKLGNDYVHLNLDKYGLSKENISFNELLDDDIKDLIEVNANKELKLKKKEENILEKILDSQKKKIKQFENKKIKYKDAGDAIYKNYNKIDFILSEIRKARDKGIKYEEIEKVLIKNKKKLEIFERIDKKNRKIIFNLHQQ